MKFDALCEFILINERTEGNRDSMTGKDKVFSLTEDAIEKAEAMLTTDPDIDSIINRSAIKELTGEYICNLVKRDLTDYLPAETSDIIQFITRDVWRTFDVTEKKSKRTAKYLFSLLKSRKILRSGIKKNDNDPSDDDIEALARELEYDVAEDEFSSGLSMGQVGKLGGMTPYNRSHPEDESEWH